WADMDLSPNQLIDRLQQTCQQSVGQEPVGMLSRVVAPLANDLSAAVTKNGKNGRENDVILPLGKVVEILEELETLVGVPEGCQATGNKPPCATAPGRLAEQLRGAIGGLVHDAEGRVAELVVRLIEQPEFRLAGAEETLRQFSEVVQRTLENQEEL